MLNKISSHIYHAPFGKGINLLQRLDKRLALLGLHVAVLLQTDGHDADEAGGVAGLKVANLVHAALAHVVQLLGLGPAAEDAEGALVGTAADLAVDVLLGGDDRVLEVLALGREVETVVKDLDCTRQIGSVTARFGIDVPWRS